MHSLEFQDFTCKRDGEPLFDPLSFHIESGDIVQIAGPNGAGKTTFLRSICGLFDDWCGAYLWNGQSMASPTYEMRCQMLYFGHHPGIKNSLTARENLTWAFGVQGRALPGSVSEALEHVGLVGYEDVLCQQMSAGQARRVALGRLFVTDAPIWVLDEPFTAIDKKGVAHLETLLAGHASNGGIALLTTHQALKLDQVRLIELNPHQGELL